MNWGLVNAYPEFDDQHRLVQVVVTVNDITEQKLIEASLRKSEAKYRLLHESMRDAFASTDMQGRIVECNPAFRAMLGYSSDELQRLTYTEITPSQWHEIEQRIVVEQILPRGYSDLYEKEYIRKDGTLLPVELRVVLTLGEDKRPAGMWAIVRDLTERKRVEKSLYQAKNELEEKVAERTADLRYINQLLRDLTASLVTNEDEERLRIAQLVHDSIVQTLSLARFKLGPTAQALDGAGLRNESTAVEQIRNLLKDAIGQCRLLVSDLAPPILYEVGLLPALQDLALRLSQENAVAISVHVAAPPPQLDRKRRGLLFQCTRELLLNGIKHAETFSFEVRLSGTADSITVLVEDHGQGFDVRSLHARRKRPGHGFGLFHIRQRVEGLGGSMEVQSERKKGTRITLRIPIHDA
jgi:PAS domain S-box-containing protein